MNFKASATLVNRFHKDSLSRCGITNVWRRTAATMLDTNPAVEKFKPKRTLCVWKHDKKCLKCQQMVYRGEIDELESFCEPLWLHQMGFQTAANGTCSLRAHARIIEATVDQMAWVTEVSLHKLSYLHVSTCIL
eukprot:Platyproteum_vivax@DN4957_c0_g1_i1.p1